MHGLDVLGAARPSYETRACYAPFKSYLASNGFKVYPTEFGCNSGYSEHPLVDIAAKMGNYFWAFEYKSINDSMSRGVEQLQCYREWFDYVVLVTEKDLRKNRSPNYWKLKTMGAGLWCYEPGSKCIARSDPVLQHPNKSLRRVVKLRFRKLDSRAAGDEGQRRICEYLPTLF